MQRIWTCLIFVFMVAALTFSVARAEENSPQNLTKEQQSKIQEVEVRLSNLVDALADSKKEEYNTIIEDLASSDKIVSDAIYNFVLKCERPKIRVDLVGVLKKINPEKAAQVEQELLEKCKNAIKPGMDYHASGELLWEMRSYGPAAGPYYWELFNNAKLKDIKHLILQKIIELDLPDTREKILHLLESGIIEPASLITAAAKFPDTDQRAKKVILPLLQQQDTIIRLAAFQALTKLKAPELYKDSIAKIDDPDVLVRQGAIEYLEGYMKVSPENAAAAANDIIKKIPEQYAELNELIFKSDLQLLSMSRSAPALEYLKNRFSQEDNQAFREKFLMTLAEMGTAAAYEYLMEQYEQMRERVKEVAEQEKKNAFLAMQLMIIKNMRHPADLKAARNETVITGLIAILRNPGAPDIHRIEACLTLQALSGKSIGMNPNSWNNWWTEEKEKNRFAE